MLEEAMEKVFESLINVAPIIIEMFEGNAGICICNENECIYSLDGKNVNLMKQIQQY
jgi:hypothetical protein